MYRVELKELSNSPILCPPDVPNVPCGVESGKKMVLDIGGVPFLMYRVELKVI